MLAKLSRSIVRWAWPALSAAALTQMAACGGGQDSQAPVEQSRTAALTVVAGVADAFGASTDGPGSTARFYAPYGIAVDGDGNIYVADQLNRSIRKITAAGQVSTLAGSAGTNSRADGSGSAAAFVLPTGLTLDAAGNLLVADGLAIRKVTPAGVVTTAVLPPPGSNLIDGRTLPNYELGGVAVTPGGDLYDTYKLGTRKTTPVGTATIEGIPIPQNGTSAVTGTAYLVPRGIAADKNGTVYAADLAGGAINKLSGDGKFSAIAGTPGVIGYADGTGPAASFSRDIIGLAIDATGDIYVADQGNGLIRKITPAGVVTTVAGMRGGNSGPQSDPLKANLSPLGGVAVDKNGYLYVTTGNAVVKIGPMR
jgi:sugar lactone lactonase YvrE